MANVIFTPQENEIHQIKPKNSNTQYYLSDEIARSALSNIQVSLDNTYTSTQTVLSLTSPATGDSFQTAISKLHTGLVADELILTTGLNRLNDDITTLENFTDSKFESIASILNVFNTKITTLETTLGNIETLLQSI